MTTTTRTAQEATMTAQSLTGVRWIENGRVVGFESGRLFGVTDGAGRWATFSDTRPGSWDRKATAAEIAATANAADLAWIEAV